jgi:hypothetical protein
MRRGKVHIKNIGIGGIALGKDGGLIQNNVRDVFVKALELAVDVKAGPEPIRDIAPLKTRPIIEFREGPSLVAVEVLTNESSFHSGGVERSEDRWLLKLHRIAGYPMFTDKEPG